MVLDQQEAENTNSIISTQTNQQTSDTSTNRQNPDTNTFNVDTRTINTINSPTPQQEIDTDTEEQPNQQLESDYLRPSTSYTPSSRSQIIPPQQEQNLTTAVTRPQPSTSLYPTISRPQIITNPHTNSQRSQILTNPYNRSIQDSISTHTNIQQTSFPRTNPTSFPLPPLSNIFVEPNYITP